jgi:antitoxin ParD1/3/4
MNLQLSPQAEKIIQQQLALGYANAGEVVENALLLIQDATQQKIAHLRAALLEGEQSGDAVPFDLATIMAEADAEFAAGIVEFDPIVMPSDA